MAGLTYDAGALLAAEADRLTIWIIHHRALARGVRPVVPAVVLAQVWRGGPQPLLSRLLRGCAVETFDESLGRAVGTALAEARTADVVDAAVVLGALRRGDFVVTSDRRDLARIASALGARLDVHSV